MICPRQQSLVSTWRPFRHLFQFLGLLWVITPFGELLAQESEDYAFLRDRDPRNLNYVAGTARVLLWTGPPDDEATLLEYERSLWAEDEDIWKFELRALAATDNPDSHRYAEELFQQALNLLPESAWVEGFPTYLERSAIYLSHELGSDYYYQDDSMVVLSVADGPDSGRFGRTKFASTAVKFLSLFGLHRFRPDRSVFWKFAYYRKGDLYGRKGVGLELHYQF